MDLSTVLAFLAKGSALWVVAGILTTMYLACTLVCGQVFAADGEVRLRRLLRLTEKLNKLPFWILSLSGGFRRATFAAGLPSFISAVIADVLLFVLGWPWVVPLIAEILYEWWSE